MTLRVVEGSGRGYILVIFNDPVCAVSNKGSDVSEKSQVEKEAARVLQRLIRYRMNSADTHHVNDFAHAIRHRSDSDAGSQEANGLYRVIVKDARTGERVGYVNFR